MIIDKQTNFYQIYNQFISDIQWHTKLHDNLTYHFYSKDIQIGIVINVKQPLISLNKSHDHTIRFIRKDGTIMKDKWIIDILSNKGYYNPRKIGIEIIGSDVLVTARILSSVLEESVRYIDLLVFS